jgi:hypothetical protein
MNKFSIGPNEKSFVYEGFRQEGDFGLTVWTVVECMPNGDLHISDSVAVASNRFTMRLPTR